MEALRDRTTVLMSMVVSVVLPVFVVATGIRGATSSDMSPRDLGAVLATYLLINGLLPSAAAVGITAGQFAGEKEQGSLTPLLASPASNVAIFGGKILGAVLPALLFSAIAEVAYLLALAGLVGIDKVRLISPLLALGMLLLVPEVALFAAILASFVSSRVRSFNAAQQISGILVLPVIGLVSSVAYFMGSWGRPALAPALAGLLALDVVTWLATAGTWRREEVLGRL
jgi:ABC-2 type transport system permease protein